MTQPDTAASEEQDAKLIRNERAKLLATAFNTAATSCVTVGLLTPLAAILYDLGGARAAIRTGSLVLGVAAYLIAAVVLHLAARRVLKGLRS
jgi:hypothetical protein